jgi:outer membrane protein assembly factor BamB/methionine-rich copper-binding protein CopC
MEVKMRFNKFLILFVVSLVICITVMGSVSAAGNNSTTSDQYKQSNYIGPQTNTTKWINNSISGANGAAPRTAITEDGTKYIYSWYSDGSALYGQLQAINPNGTVLWTCNDLGGQSFSKGQLPMVINNGTIYVLNYDLYAIDSINGTKKWTYNIGATTTHSNLVMGPDGIIYFATSINGVYAIDTTLPNPDQEDPKWVYFNSNIRGGVTLSPDAKTLYFGSYSSSDPLFYALNTADGTEKWNYTTGQVASTPVVLPDGTIYIATYNGTFYALDPDNSENRVKWSCTIQRVNSAIPVVGSDGLIYIGTQPTATTGNFYVLDPNNSTNHIKWSYNTGPIISTAAVGADGTIYIGTNRNALLYAFNPDGTVKWQYSFNLGASNSVSSPMIGPDGTLYVFTSGTVLFYAFQDLIGNFTSTPGSGLDVSFVDTSSNIPKSWIWDFGDGSDLVYDVQNPTHTYSASGTYTVKLTVITEGGDMDTVEKVITVNQAPILDLIGDRTVDENKSLTFTVVGHDSVGDNLTYSVTGLPDGATFNSATGAFSWTPTFNQAGTYHITFTVSDGSLTASETITITVNDVDNVAPTVVTVDPANNKVINGVNKAIVITFSENIKAGSAFSNIKVTNPDGVAVNPLYKVINGKTLTLTRIGNYINGLTYTITLPTGSITDMVGNVLSAFTSKFTVDNAKPIVSSVNPANNKVINGVNKAIVITFSENIKAGSAFTSIKVTNPDGVSVKPLYKVINGKTLTLTRNGNYINGLTYTITLPTGSITDTAGNALTTFTSKFKVDNAKPTVTSVNPTNNKIINMVNKAIVITFSENIKAGSAFTSIKVTNPDGVSVKPLYKVINGKTLTLTRNGNYINGLTYTITLPTGSITDTAGNALSTFTSKFKVDNTKPTVTTVNPTNNKIINMVNKAIVITFSENIKAGSAFTSIKVTNANGVKVNPLYKVINGKTLTLTRNGNYINGLTYTITLPTGSITDTAGNAITTYTSKFTTRNT